MNWLVLAGACCGAAAGDLHRSLLSVPQHVDDDGDGAYPWRNFDSRGNSGSSVGKGKGYFYGGNVTFTCPAGPYLSPSERRAREAFLSAHWESALGGRRRRTWRHDKRQRAASSLAASESGADGSSVGSSERYGSDGGSDSVGDSGVGGLGLASGLPPRGGLRDVEGYNNEEGLVVKSYEDSVDALAPGR